jgi:ABC-2 type transport system ATP-binding protein
MIELDRVEKRFGKTLAVRGVCLSVPRGQVVGILGPNGAGKSTTIRMITALLPPTRGSVRVDGLDTLDHSRSVRARLGYLPESNPLHPEMPVRDYLRFRARLFGVARSKRRAAIDRAIERCWLADVARRPIGHLSKGYRQRIGLAAALLHDPPILILDEPTTGLDPSQIAETRRLMRDLAGDRTMLLVSHILPEVEKTCDRIIVFARGRVQADGAPEALLRSVSTGYLIEARAEDGAAPVSPETLGAIPGAASATAEPLDDGWTRLRIAPSAGADLREPIAATCAARRWRVRELRPETASLEAFYLRLLERDDTPSEEPAP